MRAAGVLIGLQALGIVAFGVVAGVSGIRDGHTGPALAQVGYFVVLALFIAAVAAALLRGRRWGRTPGIVVQIITIAIGGWLASYGEHLAWGLALVLLGLVVGALLLSPAATVWIQRFPALFGPDAEGQR